MYTSFISQL